MSDLRSISPVRTMAASWLAALCLCAVPAGAQHAPAQPGKPAFRSECVAAVSFCVAVPSSWKRVGEIYDNLGFIAAEARSGADPSSWPQLTVIAFQPPASSPSAQGEPAAPSLDVLVNRMLTPSGALASAQTLSRSRLMLNGAPAEIVRVQLPGKAGSAEAIEEVALIEGEDGFIYSVALRCAPQEFDRLEAIFQHAVQSWHIRQTAASPAKKPGTAKPSSAAPAQPKQDSARP